MKLTISKLSSKEVETQYGKKKRLSFQCNGEWYSAFQHPQTDTWRDGLEIDVEVKKSGNYNNIVFPKQNGNGRATNDREPPEVLDRLAQIMKEILEIKALLSGKSNNLSDYAPKEDEGAPF